MADYPTPPNRAPLRDRPTTVQQAVTDPGTNPPLPEAPGDVQGAVRRLGPERPDAIRRTATAATPKFKPPMSERLENIQGAALRRDIVQRHFAHQVECPGGGDEEFFNYTERTRTHKSGRRPPASTERNTANCT
ncbi:unnamed protein product [Ectocarpus sp. 4 AP-2014]